MRRALHGRDHEEPGAVSAVSAAGWGLAISRGHESPAAKVEPNEDACGIRADEGSVIAVVADAHWGAASAIALVDAVLAHGPSREALHAATEALAGERSACAWLAVSVVGREVRWWSQGDCRLYRLVPPRIVNPLRPAYLDGRVGPVGLEAGLFTLQDGERLVLATDGLPECVYGEPTLGAAAIAEAVERAGPDAAEALVRLALEHGGEDNVAVIVSA